MWTVSQKLYVVLKSEKKTFYLTIPFCFNENTKCLAAHEIELRWNQFNIHKFPPQSTNTQILVTKLELLFSVKNITFNKIAHRR